MGAVLIELLQVQKEKHGCNQTISVPARANCAAKSAAVPEKLLGFGLQSSVLDTPDCKSGLKSLIQG